MSSKLDTTLDRIEKKVPALSAILLAAVFTAASLLCGVGTSQAQPGETAAILEPQSSDYVNDDSRQVVGLTKDRWGRVTLTIDWNGGEYRSLQMGRMVHGEWTAYPIEVVYDRGQYPHLNQAYAYLASGSNQLVSLTTTDAQPHDIVEVREFPTWFTQPGSPYKKLVYAPVTAIPLG